MAMSRWQWRSRLRSHPKDLVIDDDSFQLVRYRKRHSQEKTFEDCVKIEAKNFEMKQQWTLGEP